MSVDSDTSAWRTVERRTEGRRRSRLSSYKAMRERCGSVPFLEVLSDKVQGILSWK